MTTITTEFDDFELMNSWTPEERFLRGASQASSSSSEEKVAHAAKTILDPHFEPLGKNGMRSILKAYKLTSEEAWNVLPLIFNEKAGTPVFRMVTNLDEPHEEKEHSHLLSFINNSAYTVRSVADTVLSAPFYFLKPSSPQRW